MPDDIFSADVTLADEVFIVAPGLGGVGHFERIPEGATVFAVNYGIAAPMGDQSIRLHKRFSRVAWVVADSGAGDAKWWSRAEDSFANLAGTPSRDLIWGDLLSGYLCQAYGYKFAQGPAIDYRDAFPTYGVIRCNATVVGAALQIIYWLWHNSGKRVEGVSIPARVPDSEIAIGCMASPPQVHLVGCDMMGGKYFDGSGPYPEREGQSWPHLAALQELCDVLQGAGMPIDAWGPTALILDGGNK